MFLAGIDFGSKLSGFTSIALFNDDQIEIVNSVKGKDADKLIEEVFRDVTEGIICIDAPLSLPIRYSSPNHNTDYFYRQCDKELSAMSPMFIGGLTARAIRQADQLRVKGLTVYESYPKALAAELGLHKDRYKKENIYQEECFEMLLDKTDLSIQKLKIHSWHEFDALLCLISADRINNGNAKTYGSVEEGLILI